MSLPEHEKWMQVALQQAKKALQYDEVPVGAVIVLNNEIIGTGFNQVIRLSDPTAHAEIIALRQAGMAKHNYRLPECDIYVTLESCMMCLGAMVHARLRCVYFATTEPKAGVICSQAHLHQSNFLNHRLDVQGGVLMKEASQLLKDFFKKKRSINC
ncbi:tRNA adenosine(34) deaminase TadA [Fastidiosibacter lacustris]|uniref:tRNA adenosine(34) deaminase TadA n=1 Tax=Fastidiosibacter lacustris TaxID=2056695 RepID=UPI000E34AD31|nr:tRNA adenosine(34) deaminase TadA [Fastidiosibacter lacustris]